MTDFEFSRLQGVIAAQESEIAKLRAENASLREAGRLMESLHDQCVQLRAVLEAEVRPLRELHHTVRTNPSLLATDPDEIEPHSEAGC